MYGMGIQIVITSIIGLLWTHIPPSSCTLSIDSTVFKPSGCNRGEAGIVIMSSYTEISFHAFLADLHGGFEHLLSTRGMLIIVPSPSIQTLYVTNAANVHISVRDNSRINVS